MQQGERFFTIITVLIIGLVVQLVLGFADQRETPAKVAVAFSKAYFNLDPSMADYLCSDLAPGDETDPVGDFITQTADNALLSGFDLNYMRSRLFAVHTEILNESDTEVQVRVTAQRKRNINPVFTVIGKLFSIGETVPVDETLQLVKEDGRWKVCGRAFSLSV